MSRRRRGMQWSCVDCGRRFERLRPRAWDDSRDNRLQRQGPVCPSCRRGRELATLKLWTARERQLMAEALEVLEELEADLKGDWGRGPARRELERYRDNLRKLKDAAAACGLYSRGGS